MERKGRREHSKLQHLSAVNLFSKVGSKGRKAVPTLGGGEEREGRCPVSERMGLVIQKLPQDKQVKGSLAWILSECFWRGPFFEGDCQGHPVDEVPT